MKTKLLICFLALNLISLAQTGPKIYIRRVLPDTVCPGDSVKVDFVYTSPSPITYTVNNICHFTVGPALTVIWSGDYNLFASMPKEQFYPYGSTDSSIIIKLKIPANSPIGHSTMYPDPNNLGGFYVKNCQVATGIKENNYELNELPVYFDLQGNQINKKANELIIEQIGLQRKKIFIYQP